ncbi:MAG: hypothetical protein AW09_004087 [Candidatus Accumulibacter phosphatis]|uniref:Uncharacterized protein n=1 Tax=Candidatus Accumulibacter phosphatis TaxID=327160 RepID=A0A080LRG4_9PROT|nr:MAG: hypothetical protein AW09_004087 [Candidatus Accumulibacter phosphatis]
MSPFEQDDIAAPDRAKRLFGIKGDRYRTSTGIDDRHLFALSLLPDPDHDHAGTRVEAGQHGEHPLLGDEFAPGQPVRLRLHADVGGHPQHQGRCRLFIRQGEIVDQAFRIDPDPLILGDRGEALNNAVREFFSHYQEIADVRPEAKVSLNCR